MAGKTLIGGTGYDISSGKMLVGSTSYKVKNGKVLINGTSYDISFLLPPAALNIWTEGRYSGYDTITGIAYANGYWVVSGTFNGSARIAYATSLNGPWTTKTLWSGGKYYTTLRCVTYANGYWVVGGQYDGTHTYARIAYATSPSGTWTTKDLWTYTSSSSTVSNYITCIAYGDGYWVVGGQYQTSDSSKNARVAYATSLDGTWTTMNIESGYSSTRYVSGICYANGYWVGVSLTHSSTSARAVIFYKSGAPTSFTTQTLSDGFCPHGIAYVNGRWVAYGEYADIPALFYGNSLSGPWTRVMIESGDSNYNSAITGLVYEKGYYVASLVYYNSGLYTAVAYATSLDGPWTVNDLWLQGSGTTNGGGKSPCITYSDGYFVVGGVYYDNSYYNGRIAYASTPNELSGGT